MDISTLAIYSVHRLHIPTGPIVDRKIMEDVAVIYKSSPREATPSLQSERITSALSFLSIRTHRPASSRHRRERSDLRHRSAARAKLHQADLASTTNNP